MGKAAYLPQETIRCKRDGGELEAEQIRLFVRGITDESISDAQVGAFAMAVYFNGMTVTECAALTEAMVHSGDTLNWRDSGIEGPVVDKHSTGGVGDKVSLMLAPIVAACGAFVPMISGRGLGHTGGTLDKLDSIEGYDTQPSRDRFINTVKQAGCAIIGQTADLAPADRRLYAIRDVTATVESIPLITASILSKKLAAGLDALVMDVKFGSGAFMQEIEAARRLASSIASVARDAGTPTTALLTDMNQALGTSIGNALEVQEAVDFLTGNAQDERLRELTLSLAGDMLFLVDMCDSVEAGRRKASGALDSGAAAEVFSRMVKSLGGPGDFVVRCRDYLPAASVQMPVPATDSGLISRIDTRTLGIAVLELGGGRRHQNDTIDHAVGLSAVCAIGDAVTTGDPLAMVHAGSQSAAVRAVDKLRAAFIVASESAPAGPVVRERITA